MDTPELSSLRQVYMKQVCECVWVCRAEVFVWGRGEYGRLGLGDRSGSSKLRATKVFFKEPDTRIVQASSLLLSTIYTSSHYFPVRDAL